MAPNKPTQHRVEPAGFDARAQHENDAENDVNFFFKLKKHVGVALSLPGWQGQAALPVGSLRGGCLQPTSQGRGLARRLATWLAVVLPGGCWTERCGQAINWTHASIFGS